MAQPTFGYPTCVTESRPLSASIIFKPRAAPLPTREELASAARRMLSTLASEHRIRDEYVCGWIGEHLTAGVECHDSDALEFLSVDGAPTILDDFEREYAHRPSLLKQDDDFGRPPLRSVDHETFIFLTTNSLDSAPPIRARVRRTCDRRLPSWAPIQDPPRSIGLEKRVPRAGPPLDRVRSAGRPGL